MHSHYRGRYYDPTLGRFSAEDPIQLRGGINFYSYARNNPRTLTDPLGFAPGSPKWWESFKQALRECWKDPWGCGGKPGGFGAGPDAVARNLCDSSKGQKYLFGEGSPVNPYYGKDATSGRSSPETDAAVTAWREAFNAKCYAAKNRVVFCGESALGPNGPFKVCACCETCEGAGKK
jgi:uncharacterized protein RhaS with RHS repeats